MIYTYTCIAIMRSGSLKRISKSNQRTKLSQRSLFDQQFDPLERKLCFDTPARPDIRFGGTFFSIYFLWSACIVYFLLSLFLWIWNNYKKNLNVWCSQVFVCSLVRLKRWLWEVIRRFYLFSYLLYLFLKRILVVSFESELLLFW